MTPDQHQRYYHTADRNSAQTQQWGRIQDRLQAYFGRCAVCAGRIRFSSSEITHLLQSSTDDQGIVDGAMHAKGLNPVALGRWLKDRLVDAPINGLVLRSAKDRTNTGRFWVERSNKDA
jgi:hypothetical protein